MIIVVQKERDYYEEELKRERKITESLNKENSEMKIEINSLKTQAIKDQQMIELQRESIIRNDKDKEFEIESLNKEISSMKTQLKESNWQASEKQIQAER